jgi:recombination protein RecA
MGVTFGNPESLPGGKTVQYASSLMIRVRRGKWITDVVMGGEDDEKDAKRLGFVLRLRTEKNKLAPPWQNVDVEFKFDGTIDPTGALIRLAIERGVIEVTSPGYFEIEGYVGKIHGLETLKNELRDTPYLQAEIVKRVQESKMKEPF